jgi:peroxiredoxin
MLALGTAAPDFALPDVVSGKNFSLRDFEKKSALLVMFICNHCPYVQHIRAELARLGRDYASSDLGLIAISSNDAQNYPDDAPEELKRFAEMNGFVFPLLFDETQRVAKSYTAACTPDFFLFDADRKLVYRGQLDGSRPGQGTPDGRDLRAAMDAVLNHQPVNADQKASIGCNIKWKPGNEPEYFGLKKS